MLAWQQPVARDSDRTARGRAGTVRTDMTATVGARRPQLRNVHKTIAVRRVVSPYCGNLEYGRCGSKISQGAASSSCCQLAKTSGVG